MLYHNVTVFTVYLLYIYFTIIIISSSSSSSSSSISISISISIINFIYYKIIKNIYIYNSQITNKEHKIK